MQWPPPLVRLGPAYRYAAEQRHALDNEGWGTRCRDTDIADISTAKDSRSLVLHLETFGHLDIETTKAPET